MNEESETVRAHRVTRHPGWMPDDDDESTTNLSAPSKVLVVGVSLLARL